MCDRETKLVTVAFFAAMLLFQSDSAVGASATPAPTTPVWLITHGGPQTDSGWGVALDDEGFAYLVGHDTISALLANIFLIKVDASTGRQVWNSSWGGPQDEEGLKVVVDSGAVYIGGRTQNPDGSFEMLIQAYNATTGGLDWTTKWSYSPHAGYNEVDGIAVDGDSLYIAGWAAVPSRSNDIGLLKLQRTTGSVLWNSTWGSENWDEANGDIVVDSSRIYVAGRYNAPNILAGGRALIASFSKTDGSLIKNVTWSDGGAADYYGLTGDRHFLYAVGVSIANGGDSIVIHKYDEDLNQVWTTSWLSSGSESARALQVTPAGDQLVVIGKTTGYGKGSFDALLLGISTLDGGLDWAATYGGTGSDEPHGMALGGNYAYVAGDTSSSGAGKDDAFLAKFQVAIQATTTTSTTGGSGSTASTSSSTAGSQTTTQPSATASPGLALGLIGVVAIVIISAFLIRRRR